MLNTDVWVVTISIGWVGGGVRVGEHRDSLRVTSKFNVELGKSKSDAKRCKAIRVQSLNTPPQS